MEKEEKSVGPLSRMLGRQTKKKANLPKLVSPYLLGWKKKAMKKKLKKENEESNSSSNDENDSMNKISEEDDSLETD